jgi:hypothetical protein
MEKKWKYPETFLFVPIYDLGLLMGALGFRVVSALSKIFTE